MSTSSRSLRFGGIVNRDEVYNVILSLINQGEEKSPESSSKPASGSSTDELRKYKQLLDDGIITQEEFDAKKKQLLDL